MEVVAERPSVRVTNIPQTITAKELLQYLVAQLGKDSVFAIEISTVRKNWNSRGFGRVQFDSLEVKHEAYSLSLQNKLVLKSQNLKLSETYDDIIPRPFEGQNRLENRGFVWQEFRYKLVVEFEDILEAVGYPLDGDKVNAVVLKLRYGPRIYQKISGPDIASKYTTNRYFYCKEDFDFLWVRTTDFSSVKSIGQSTSFCWEIGEGLGAFGYF
ncbi:RNA-DEPENDENT RNA polymerase 2 [Salix purpurea]|uniref:RNA-DEPENDENT RNA polymerase 2 n=1 Tax=Salix purpurea TaxID=77065 RepID=A0A9Q0W7X2_SALPP|nr:RNA-DEPENDENT RNA polymerase 2 [Salix purpurea]